MTRETPYQRLLQAVRKYKSAVSYPKRVTMWVYGRGKLGEGWNLKELYERTAAAHQLGFDVRLVAAEDGLRVEYVERPGDIEYVIY